jgi:hypothetical protein
MLNLLQTLNLNLQNETRNTNEKIERGGICLE